VFIKDENAIVWCSHGKVALEKCAIGKVYTTKTISNCVVGLS
jgi:hypothetical protein